MVTEAQLLQQAVAGILSTKARTQFTKTIESLNMENLPMSGLFEHKD